MNRVSKTFCAAALTGVVALGAYGARNAVAADRGKSGLPPGPGNPIAAIYKQLQALQSQIQSAVGQAATLWINHLDFVPGGTEIDTAFDSTNSGVGGGLSGLIVTSSTTGETFTSGGNKVIEKGIQVPPNYNVTGVRICYESTSAASFISQIRLAQLQEPPSSAVVRLDDGTDHTDVGPVCFNSAAPTIPINPADGALRLSLRFNFGNTADKVVIRGVGLLLQRTGL